MKTTTKIAAALATATIAFGAAAQMTPDNSGNTMNPSSPPMPAEINRATGNGAERLNSPAPTTSYGSYGSEYSSAANTPMTRERAREDAARALRNGDIPFGDDASQRWAESPNVFQHKR